MTSNYLILKNGEKWTVLTLSYTLLSLQRRLSKKKKIYNLYYPDFFLFKMYLLFGHNEWKTQIKKWSPFAFHRKKATKGQVQLARREDYGSDQFARRDWCEFQDKHLFSRVELSKSLLKAFGPQKGPFYLSLGDWWKLLQPLKLPYYGQQVMRSVKQESYGLLLRFCLNLRYMDLQLYFFTFTLNYSRLPITRTFKWNRKRFELSGARRKWPGVRKKTVYTTQWTF